MKLGRVVADCGGEVIHDRSVAGGPPGAIWSDREISGIAYDSRKVEKDTLFVAVAGECADGHAFIEDALAKGAAVVIGERTGQRTAAHPPLAKGGRGRGDVLRPVFILVQDSRKALACVSNNFYERPSEDATVIGVTGTNGKTTTTYLLKSILEAAGEKVGIIGTIRYLIGKDEYPAFHTTPEAPEFQGLLRRMVSAGCSSVVAEVSSHALSLKRADFTRFACAVFTNLTRDHLDFHGTMEQYFDAKKRLFTGLLPENGIAVINRDDAWGRKLLPEMADRKIITYGIDSDADVRATAIGSSFSGLSFTLEIKDGSPVTIDSPFLGRANVYNVLAAAAAAAALNISGEAIVRGVASARAVEGRMEKIEAGQRFLCIVDYAHTPDALERLIVTAREIVAESSTQHSALSAQQRPKVITVFGCGGNRDRGKRPLMGEIASRLSDAVYITSDNPRNEDPLEIIKEIKSGIINDNCFIVPDRREAIAAAIENASAGDIVILAGKGHEEYQEIGGKRSRFSDREVAREAILKKLGEQKDPGSTKDHA